VSLKNQGLIMGNDGRKMSKRWGNIVNPDDVVNQFGADTLRVYEMFMGPFDQPISWSTDNMVGSRRFIERVWKLREKINPKSEIRNPKQIKNNKIQNSKPEFLIHKTIKKVSEDIEDFHFNTAISALMILLNEMEKEESLSSENYKLLIKLLSPFAPHIAEELWFDIGGKKSIHLEDWPKCDESKLQSDEVTIIVQVNGKVRGSFKAVKDQKQEEIESIALSLPPVKKWVGGNQIKKIFFVKGKVVSILT
jgi:leucyl-tRNA synthetase